MPIFNMFWNTHLDSMYCNQERARARLLMLFRNCRLPMAICLIRSGGLEVSQFVYGLLWLIANSDPFYHIRGMGEVLYIYDVSCLSLISDSDFRFWIRVIQSVVHICFSYYWYIWISDRFIIIIKSFDYLNDVFLLFLKKVYF